jgi:integrase
MQQSKENVAFLPNSAEKLPPGDIWAWPPGQKPAGGSEPLPPPSDDASGLPIERLTLLDVESDPDPRLFPLHRSHVWKLVHGYMLEAGIPKYKCKTHTLKHTIAKHLVRAGVPVNEIMEWMGWRSMETMMWYIRADEEELGQGALGTPSAGRWGCGRCARGACFERKL